MKKRKTTVLTTIHHDEARALFSTDTWLRNNSNVAKIRLDHEGVELYFPDSSTPDITVIGQRILVEKRTSTANGTVEGLVFSAPYMTTESKKKADGGGTHEVERWRILCELVPGTVYAARKAAQERLQAERRVEQERREAADRRRRERENRRQAEEERRAKAAFRQKADAFIQRTRELIGDSPLTAMTVENGVITLTFGGSSLSIAHQAELIFADDVRQEGEFLPPYGTPEDEEDAWVAIHDYLC